MQLFQGQDFQFLNATRNRDHGHVSISWFLLLSHFFLPKPNSWKTYNLVEVFRHNLESLSDLRFLYGFFKPWFSIRFFSFILYSVQLLTVEIYKRLCEFEEIRKRLREFEEIQISRQSCVYRWLWIARRKILKTLSRFRPRIGPQILDTSRMKL